MKRNEKGFALVWVLVVLILCSLLLVPLLLFMAVGLSSSGGYERKMQAFYAADAGIEAGLYRIMTDGSPGHFDLVLNGFDVEVDVVAEFTEWEMLGKMADQPIGQVFHAEHPHAGENWLEVSKSFVEGYLTIDVANGGEARSKIITGVGLWIRGDVVFDRVLEGLSGEPEVLAIFGGTSFIWKVNLRLDPGEMVRFSFEVTPAPDAADAIGWVLQSRDIWLTSSGMPGLYLIQSEAMMPCRGDPAEICASEMIESMVMKKERDVYVLTFSLGGDQ